MANVVQLFYFKDKKNQVPVIYFFRSCSSFVEHLVPEAYKDTVHFDIMPL